MSVGRPIKQKFAVAVIVNPYSLEPTLELANKIRCENRQLEPSIATMLIRTAKAKAIAKLSEAIKIQKHVKNEIEEQRYGRLEDVQNRQLEHAKNEIMK